MDVQAQQLLLNRLAQVQPQLALDQVIAYHGTRSSALQSIRDNGILSHPFKHYHPSRFYKGARGASVYVTENPNIAAQWALSEVDDPSLATILQVVVPREGLHPDEEAPEAERFLGDIPPEWIQATYQILPDGSLGPAVPFHADPRLSQAAEDDTKSKRFMVIQHKGGWSVPHFDAEFEENKHPRDNSGEFTPSGGGTRVKSSYPDSPQGKEDAASFSAPALSESDKGLIHSWKTGNSSILNKPEFLDVVRKGKVTKPITVYRAGGTSGEKALEFTTRKSWAEGTAEASDRPVVAIHLKPGDTALFTHFATSHHGHEMGVMLPPETQTKSAAHDAAAKLSKDQVEFEHPAQGPHHCGECQHFLAGNACEIVEGVIRSEDWCDKFAKKSATDAEFEENKHPRGEGGRFSAGVSKISEKPLEGKPGYKVLHGERNQNKHFVVKHPSGEEIGFARLPFDDFARPGAPQHPTVTNVHVDPEHQKQGIASALYDHIEHELGYKLKSSGGLTKAGTAMWAARNRRNKTTDAAMDSALVPLRQWALRRLAEPHKLAAALAMDRAFVPLKSERSVIAMDRGPTSRVKTEDGHLHVGLSNISKATVNPYWGREIPNFEKLGLQPDKKYMLLRHPDELAKAAKTFNNLPILAEHTPITSDKHPSELVVGSTGTDAVYKHPYLRNSLVFWPQPAIDAIEDNAQRELSCAYHYDPEMTPGVYEGQRYDGIMRNIRGNHVALVKDGRAGSDVVVGDSKESMMAKKLTPAGLALRGALFTYITPQLAMDSAGKRAQIDFNAVLAGVNSKNFGEKKKGIFNSVKMATKGKLAQDADISDLAQLLDALSPEAEQADAMMMEPNSAIPPMTREGQDDTDPTDMVSKIKAYLEEQGVSPEILANLDAFLAEPANPDPDTPTPGDPSEDGDMPQAGMDEEEEDDEKKRTAEDDIVPNEQQESVTKTAMDAAIKTAVNNTTKRILETQRNIRIAEREVQPWVGQLAFDSANGPSDVYRTALKALGMDAKEVDALHPDALKPILKAQPKPSRDDLRRPAGKKLAQDSGDKKAPSLGEMFPGASNITVQ